MNRKTYVIFTPDTPSIPRKNRAETNCPNQVHSIPVDIALTDSNLDTFSEMQFKR